MTSNHKLTAVLHGRTITAIHPQGTTLILTFADGATMTVKTAGASTSLSSGHRGTVGKVRQQGTQLALDYDDGTTLQLPLAEATASVMVRAKDHTLEYAD
jgi:hypothetical protein